jgi:hypothetical protein
MYYRAPIDVLKTLFSSPEVSSKFSSHTNSDAFKEDYILHLILQTSRMLWR